MGQTNVQRVLIIDNHLLMGAGIQNLLVDTVDLDVIGFSPHTQTQLDQAINRFQPDVIVLDDDGHQLYLSKLLALLVELPKLRIVLVSANSDLVHIYGRQDVQITDASQLINIIRAS